MAWTLRGENFTPVNSIAETRIYQAFLADGKLRLKDIAENSTNRLQPVGRLQTPEFDCAGE
jgi:hypothetical protein